MNRTQLKAKANAAANQLLAVQGYISAVDVLLVMGRLSKEDYERWRFRQVPHLEQVLPGSLNEHAWFCRELRAYANELGLRPSRTAYLSWGRGRRQPLRFSKYGDPQVEALFSTHYVSSAITDSQKARRARMPAPNSTMPSGTRSPSLPDKDRV